MTPFEEFKQREFIGDKLLDLIITDILISKRIHRNDLNKILPKYISTKALSKIFNTLDLTEHQHDKTIDPLKRKANAVEEYLYTQFITNGYHHVKIIVEKSFQL